MKQTEFKAIVSTSPDNTIPDPDAYPPGEAHLPADLSAICFKCPCGCDKRVFLPFDFHVPERTWKLESVEPLTISPSIMDHGCGSHYFLRAGKVIWC